MQLLRPIYRFLANRQTLSPKPIKEPLQRTLAVKVPLKAPLKEPLKALQKESTETLLAEEEEHEGEVYLSEAQGVLKGPCTQTVLL